MSTKKDCAEESPKTRKAREKLKKQLDDVERQITPQALQKKTIEIHRWIARHAPQRIVLKSKEISLFDENQNAAKLSRRVAGLAEQLKQAAPIEDSGWNAPGQQKRIVTQTPSAQDS